MNEKLNDILAGTWALSLSDIARAMGWHAKSGGPDKNRARRECEAMLKAGRAWKNRNGKFRSIETRPDPRKAGTIGWND